MIDDLPRAMHVDVDVKGASRAELPNPWITWFGADRRLANDLVCFHSAGSGASFFRGWAAAAHPTFNVGAVQVPGRENRFVEPPPKRIRDAVADMAEALTEGRDRPFVVLGHSMGALYALECAHRLARRGFPPALLVLSASTAPTPGAARFSAAERTDQELVEHLRRLGGTPEDVLADTELLGLVLPTLRADLHAVDTYTVELPLVSDVPTVLVAGSDDVHAGLDGVLAWRSILGTDVPCQIMPGGHFYLRDAANVARLVELCRSAVAAPARITED